MIFPQNFLILSFVNYNYLSVTKSCLGFPEQLKCQYMLRLSEAIMDFRYLQNQLITVVKCYQIHVTKCILCDHMLFSSPQSFPSLSVMQHWSSNTAANNPPFEAIAQELFKLFCLTTDLQKCMGSFTSMKFQT